MKYSISLLLISLLSAQVAAHSRWILPSHFSLSSEHGEWIMVDVTASNETFNVDKPMGSDGIVITKPNGKTARASSSYKGHRKSVIDYFVADAGTYKITNNSDPRFMTTFKVGDRRQRLWLNKAQLVGELPKGATNVVTKHGLSRIESYVTLNKPSDNFVSDGRFLELIPITHPSDIAQGEAVTFKFLFNGKPQSKVEVKITRDGVRYRDDPKTLTLSTNEQGLISFTPADAGRYLLVAEFEQTLKDNALTDKQAGSVFLTFEALLN